MSGRYRNGGGTNWLIWAIIGIVIIAALFFLLPLLGGEEAEDDGITGEEQETPAPAFVLNGTAHTAPQLNIAGRAYIVTM